MWINGRTLLEVVLILSLAWVAGLQGMTGYYVLFAIYLLSMASTNLSPAATQGFIPDLISQEKRGVKNLLEVRLPLVILGLMIAPIVQKGNILAGLLITCAAMLVCMGLAMFVKEKPPESPSACHWPTLPLQSRSNCASARG